MTKCPKCQFQQPPDTYCANCGVNMETYRPEPTPFFKSLLTHWLFHLATVIFIIVVLVVYDRNHDRNSSAKPIATASEFTKTETTNALNIAGPANSEQQTTAVKTEEPLQKIETDEVGGTYGEPPKEKIVAKSATAPAAGNRKSAIQVTFYQATKNAFTDLARDGQSTSFSGEATGGIVDRKKITQLTSGREMRSVSSNKYKDYDGQHPIMIFKGQRAASGKNIGIFFQITPLKVDANSVQLEIKSWGNLKAQGNEENLFASEMTVNVQSGAYIAGFLPKDKTFTDEEKMVFESDRTLKIYNQDGFWDGNNDLIMVVELTEGS